VLVKDDREHFKAGFKTMSFPMDCFLFILTAIDSNKMPPVLKKYRLDYVRKET